MTKYEYFETIANNWSVTKHPLSDGSVDIYLTTPALSLIKDVDMLMDSNDELYKEFDEIRSIIPIAYYGSFKFAHVPRGAQTICVSMGRPLGKSQMQSLLENITIKYIILHFDAKLHKLFSDKEFTADCLYDHISISADDWTAKITPIFEDWSIDDPYRLQIVYDDEDGNQYFIRSFETIHDDNIKRWKWRPEDEKLENKKENTLMKLSGADFDGDVKTMTNIFDALRENWTYKEFTLNGNTRHIYITTPVLSLIGNYEKLMSGVGELYNECDWIDFVDLEWYTGKFEFPNVPKNATVIRIQLKHHTKFKNIENEIALRKVTSFFDDKLREMTEADYFDYIYADMDLATGEIRPVIEDGVIRDPYRLSWVPYADEDEEDYEYDKQHTIRNFKDFDGLTVYSWIPCKTGKEEKVADQESKDAIRPAHYDYKITPLDASFEWFKDLPSDEAILAFNVVKYISRYHKKNGDEDLKKAKTYIDFLLNLRANK